SEEHTSELQSLAYLVCRLLLEKKKRDGRLVVQAGQPQHPACVTSTFVGDPVALNRVASARHWPQDRPEPAFFFNDTATTEIYTLSLHDALPISAAPRPWSPRGGARPASPLRDAL